MKNWFRAISTAAAIFSSLAFLPGPIADSTVEDIEWMTWEEVADQVGDSQKKTLFNIYTDWCGWCKRMDQQTFNAPGIAEYINANFYPVRFDAERKAPITYKEKTYGYVASGKRGYHEFAAELLRGRMSFPSVVFIDEEGNLLQSIVGYKSPEEFERILTYFAEDHYKNTPWSIYQKQFEPRLIRDE